MSDYGLTTSTDEVRGRERKDWSEDDGRREDGMERAQR